MTTTASTGTSFGRWLLMMALALSVLFNVFFAAGYIRATSTAAEATGDPPANVDQTPRVLQLENELNLTPEQQLAFDEARLAVSEDLQRIEDRMTLVRQRIIAELRQPEPQLQGLVEAVREEAELYGQKRLVEIERLSRFLQTLSPEQTERLGQIITHQARKLDRYQRVLERFDADGDGVLNGEEREAARAEFERRRAADGESGRPGLDRFREELRRKRAEFDADGDGELNADEQRAFEAWFKQKREEWRREGGGRRGGRPPHHRRGDDRPPPPPAEPGSIASVLFGPDAPARLVF